MDKKWAYLNDIEGCEVIGLYTLHALIEIVYLKEGKPKSLTINFHVAGGSLGYFEFFKFDSIPLPPAKMPYSPSEMFTKILHVNLYATVGEHERFEELEFVCEKGSYLFFFSEDEEEAHYAKIEKDKKPSLPQVKRSEESLPKELFSVDFFKENLAFALLAHGEQKTPHGLPYSMHLLSVASEVINALYMEPLSFDENNVAIACALLHDVNEDTTTQITKESFLAGNSEVIAKGVQALTKDKTLPSKEAQMRDSLERLKKRQNCVALVKLADRITNLGVPPKHWDKAKKQKYLEEAKLILSELGYAHYYLAHKLHEKIEAYPLYM
ncbi:bifunctional (p)ppGpp synthetase/guanosine-3',5'-bis(diphosphate) 3'-pyrophosphohydrolase [Sulfurospirillum diekertiae]|uniref:Bifunctional (P)ppGpp synthetase/guanosine-3',5'-bis(Diphosphate) 3'-pyrophosphohydrolase n=1 Tax=Sulfurospirillum diekertiae TaxID=1854492 RepID=A0A858KHD3_9BACT|nr:HD domain-containing protein [Sulfurospirillum diekertiae]QIR77302.2 bifunctional (p)ppGpp synthetase/guanosine-3',5'-bis(diphosphate) 3'-pyrophosphohydrolase [Sulfurospirillum diekertiae]QIR79918.2 bifunctional (p)ppGpp synthetase/guanosine-3',5'-bis(diphosphate) 3'-pyrophosphohydrolase [Sulfurospirillum diekertiae]